MGLPPAYPAVQLPPPAAGRPVNPSVAAARERPGPRVRVGSSLRPPAAGDAAAQRARASSPLARTYAPWKFTRKQEIEAFLVLHPHRQGPCRRTRPRGRPGARRLAGRDKR